MATAQSLVMKLREGFHGFSYLETPIPRWVQARPGAAQNVDEEWSKWWETRDGEPEVALDSGPYFHRDEVV